MTCETLSPPDACALNQNKPIALRLTDEDLARTKMAAQHAGHRPTGFARHIYLIGLAHYEAKNGLLSR